MTDKPTPARTLYTAQEIADLALKWGAAATVTQDDHDVIIDLERGNESMQLTFWKPARVLFRPHLPIVGIHRECSAPGLRPMERVSVLCDVLGRV